MRVTSIAVTLYYLSSSFLVSSATRIEDPQSFVAEVYRGFIAEQSAHSELYTPPDGIYTARLAKLLHDDELSAKGEVGCLDFVFWVNGQDWTITNLTLTSADQSAERRTVIARFRNFGKAQEIRFDFRRTAGGWLLDEVRSVSGQRWTLSRILQCNAGQRK